MRATPLDITKPETLAPAFEGAHTVVSLVGLMYGRPSDFDRIQWRGAENVAKAAKEAGASSHVPWSLRLLTRIRTQTGARLIHISAIGANPSSDISYWRTKGLGEESVRAILPDATIIRPSLVFGPEDDFFNVSMSCEHGGSNLLTLLFRDSPSCRNSSHSCQCSGEVYLSFSLCMWTTSRRQWRLCAGGTLRWRKQFLGRSSKLEVLVVSSVSPYFEDCTSRLTFPFNQVYTYHDLMVTVLKYSHRWRPVVPLPYWVGMMQGLVGEMLPPNLFTVTREQVRCLFRQLSARPTDRTACRLNNCDTIMLSTPTPAQIKCPSRNSSENTVSSPQQPLLVYCLLIWACTE